jgi:hypothetical protein
MKRYGITSARRAIGGIADEERCIWKRMMKSIRGRELERLTRRNRLG